MTGLVGGMASSPVTRSTTPRTPTHSPRRPGTAELCRRADHLVKEVVALVEEQSNRQLEEQAAEAASPGRTPLSSRQESRESARAKRAATQEAAARKAASDAKWERIHAAWLAGQQPPKRTVTLDVGYTYMTVMPEKRSPAEIRAVARAEAERKAKGRAEAFRQSLAREPTERAAVAKALKAKTAAEERHDGRWPPGRDPFEAPRKVWV